ncbi:MAG: MFS transporter, partial [Burkholderiales bacterium]|nr:MFS transporter [Burkholderiales bacterium]
MPGAQADGAGHDRDRDRARPGRRLAAAAPRRAWTPARRDPGPETRHLESPLAAPARPATARPATAADIAARMDRLPTTRTLWRLVLLISLGGFFEIYDLVCSGSIAPGLARSGLLATTTATFFGFQGYAGFIAATFAGLFVGTFGLGFLPDRHGRRAMFTASLLCYCASSAVMACQTGAAGLLFWRFASGIGVGVEIVTIDAYIIELVPQQLRGRAMAFNQAVMFTAAPVAALLSYVLVPTTLAGLAGWRWVVLIGCVGAVVMGFIRRAIPESPRWLALQGRVDEAGRIVAAIEDRVRREQRASLPPPRPPQPP